MIEGEALVGLLDTSVFIASKNGRAISKLPGRVALSVITIGELQLGVLNAGDAATLAAANAHADAGDAATLTASKSYTDGKATQTLIEQARHRDRPRKDTGLAVDGDGQGSGRSGLGRHGASLPRPPVALRLRPAYNPGSSSGRRIMVIP